MQMAVCVYCGILLTQQLPRMLANYSTVGSIPIFNPVSSWQLRVFVSEQGDAKDNPVDMALGSRA